MATSDALTVRYVADDSWRRELCPECGARLLGLAAWKAHGWRHGWASEWLAARIRAARPGETIRVSPSILSDLPTIVAVHAVEDATWKSGIPA